MSRRPNKPPSPLSRIMSLMKTGPRALMLRFYDQGMRKWTGSPVWNLSRITPNLYIGGQHRAMQAMQQEGITAIVNMRENDHNDVKKGIGGVDHLHLATRDNTPPSIEDLDRAADFIGGHIAKGEKVYVHCALGVGRAPTAAASYLIKYEHLTPSEAIQLIRKARPFVHLTPRQFQQLVTYEHHLHDRQMAAGAIAAGLKLKQEAEQLRQDAEKLKHAAEIPAQEAAADQLKENAEALERQADVQIDHHQAAAEKLSEEAKLPISTSDNADDA